MFHYKDYSGNNKHPFEKRLTVSPNLERPLFFITSFMARHEKARIIEPVVNMRLYDFIHIAANTADQPDI
jgi:hypothetical protein